MLEDILNDIRHRLTYISSLRPENVMDESDAILESCILKEIEFLKSLLDKYGG
jgi:hypothetical protein